MSLRGCARPCGIEIINNGRIGEMIMGSMARFQRDVIAYGPTWSSGNSARTMSPGADAMMASRIGSRRECAC